MTIETGIPRRAFLIGGSALLLVACAPAGPGSVTLVAQGTVGMNPGPDGADRPLTLQVLQLRGAGAFDGADFFAYAASMAFYQVLLKGSQFIGRYIFSA